MVRTHSQNLQVVAKLQEEPDAFCHKEPSLPPPHSSQTGPLDNVGSAIITPPRQGPNKEAQVFSSRALGEEEMHMSYTQFRAAKTLPIPKGTCPGSSKQTARQFPSSVTQALDPISTPAPTHPYPTQPPWHAVRHSPK